MPLTGTPLFFDEEADFSVTEGRLPHWEQAGSVCFITFRTWDSMPKEVVSEFAGARLTWLRENNVAVDGSNWEAAVAKMPRAKQIEFRRLCSTRWENSLDRCHGSCPLRGSALSGVVADSLHHFDGIRYVLFDFVVMPNHAHVLASFPQQGAMQEQCRSWKHYTATRLNKLLSRHGRFWEEESFDHLVRSEPQFERLRDYIADNPREARLRHNEFVHYSRDLPASPGRVAPLAERADHPAGAIQ